MYCTLDSEGITPTIGTMVVMMVLQVERSSIVAAGALVTPGTTVPTGQIWAGRPAKLLREMAEGEADFIEQSAINYSALADVHADENAKTAEEIQVQSSSVMRASAISPPKFLRNTCRESLLCCQCIWFPLSLETCV